MGREGKYARRNFAARVKTTCNVCVRPVVLVRGNDGNMTVYDSDERVPHTCKRKKHKPLDEMKEHAAGQLQLDLL